MATGLCDPTLLQSNQVWLLAELCHDAFEILLSISDPCTLEKWVVMRTLA
jgi:hypothetical protein